MTRESPVDLLERTRNLFAWLEQIGCQGFECGDDDLRLLNGWGQQAPAGMGRESLDHIRSDLGDCRRCGLHQGRNCIVFGAGNPDARLMFVGEGPGREEDLQGKPFVGPAGQLLNRIITAMGLTRETVYIANVVKCRPPDNRGPQADEISACRPFLERQIRSVRPDYICALGSFAARELLNTDRPISRLRGRFHRFGSISVMPTYHPAYLLRNPGQKRAVWEDVQQLMAAMQGTGETNNKLDSQN